MAQVFISLGTNIDRRYYVEQGLNALNDAFGKLTLSSLFESEAVGFSGKPFFNMVIGFNTEESLLQMSKVLREIEFANGREKNAKKFSPRTLDLDILLYDNVIMEQPVQLPRTEILQNAFVLWPLAEVAPNLLHPLVGKSYQQLWQRYDKASQQLVKIPLSWSRNNKEF